MTIRLSAHGYNLVGLPEHGATIVAATWQHEDGDPVTLLQPLLSPGNGFNGGSFIMAPFVNRIADGRFSFGGQIYAIPINRPEAGMSIHGFSRDKAWKIEFATADHAKISDTVASPDHPWHYTIMLELKIDIRGIRLALSLRNDGGIPLPFGIGFHPFFPRRVQSTLKFTAEGSYASDKRGLPSLPFSPSVGIGTGEVTLLDKLRGLDRCFRNWNPRQARIDWPTDNCRLTVSADGALRHLHVYVPKDREMFCIEPVSHFPDAINRSSLGAEAQMQPLLPGETLVGSMLLHSASLTEADSPSATSIGKTA